MDADLLETFRRAFDMAAPPAAPEGISGPVVNALAYNELLRLPQFLAHHRAIGVRHFFIVDNASTDGSADYLDSQPDVTRLFTAKPYREFKAVWRSWAPDAYLPGRWVLAPDIDEHFVYPGWPNTPLAPLLRHWDALGHDAVFAPMVDMYAGVPLDSLGNADEDFLALCPFFDAEGYWLAPVTPRDLRRAPTPPSLIYGGTRLRLLRGPAGPRVDRLLRLLKRRMLPLGRTGSPRLLAGLTHKALKRVYRHSLGVMSKVPLIRWRRGIAYPGSNHQVQAALDLAPDWAALLHFKYLPDLEDRAAEAVARGQHSNASRGYRQLAERGDRLRSTSLLWEGSRRLRDWRDLEEAGLMRASPSLRAALGPEFSSPGRTLL